MSIRKYLEAQPIFQMAAYDLRQERTRDSVCFTGSPRKHPYDQDKMLLIIDPSGDFTHFYEFMISDIHYYEAQASIVTGDGRTIPMAKIWIPKGRLGIEYRPFEVAEPLKRFSSIDGLNDAIQAYEENG
jgi:hypothetical protein